MSVGIEGYIANLSMQMAQANVQNAMGVKMVKSVLDSTEQNALQFVEALSEMPAPAVGEIGGLLDVRA
ncbi:MAG: YjfB family protein [Ruminiclostridium sp.]